MLVQVAPTSSCHCTEGPGVAVAAAVKLAVAPAHRLAFEGCVFTTGAVFIEREAALEVTEPQLLLTTARKLLPLSAAEVVNESVVFVSPERLVQVAPISSCHCTLGLGLPLALTEKDAVVPGHFVVLAG